MASFCFKTRSSIQKLWKCAYVSTPSLLPSTNVMRHNKRHRSVTVDDDDIKHLNKFAAEWWDPNGPLKPLHSYNFLRVPFIRDSLVTMTPDTSQSTCLEGKNILEVGCGAGVLTEELAKLGANLTGIDPSKQLVEIAIEHSKSNARLIKKPTYFQTTVEEHVEKHSNTYDAVIASEVIEHINHSQREIFIDSCVKVLKPGGKIIISTPNRTRISQLLGIYLVEALNVIPKGAHHFEKFSTQDELKYWLELNDCHVDLIKGLVYYFWSNQWKWINSQALMYFIRAVKLKAS